MDGRTEQIAFALERLAAFLRALQWQAASAQRVNPTQGAILARIMLRPERASEIAARLGVTPASLSDSVAALVAKGLAERRPDPGDRRAQILVPTVEGRALAERLEGGTAALAQAIAAVPSQERVALLFSLMRIIRALQEARAIPVQRMCVTCRHFRPKIHSDAERPHHCAFVDAAFGDADFRIECGEHEEAPEADRARVWARLDVGV